MISRRAVLPVALLPFATSCNASETERRVISVAGNDSGWVALVLAYSETMQARVEVEESATNITLRAYAPPDPNQGKDVEPIGYADEVPFTLAAPLDTRTFVRTDGSTIEPQP